MTHWIRLAQRGLFSTPMSRIRSSKQWLTSQTRTRMCNLWRKRLIDLYQLSRTFTEKSKRFLLKGGSVELSKRSWSVSTPKSLIRNSTHKTKTWIGDSSLQTNSYFWKSLFLCPDPSLINWMTFNSKKCVKDSQLSSICQDTRYAVSIKSRTESGSP